MQHEPAAEADRPRLRVSAAFFTRAVSESPVWPHVSNHIFLYKFMRTRVGSPFTDIENVCQAFYALVKYVSPKRDYFTPKGHYFAHWCKKRPFSLSVNGSQTRVLHACVKKKVVYSL